MARHFEASQATYTRWIAAALDAAPCLDRAGTGGGAHLVMTGDVAPDWASFPALLSELENGNTPEITGIEDHELPVFIPRWTRNTPVDHRALGKIVRAIHRECGLRLRYVSMKRGEEGRWRCIYPIGLERMGDQWRLVALDLDKKDLPLRVFVLARILGVDDSPCPLPKGFSKPGIHDADLSVHARPNPAMTPDQAIVTAHELRIHDGKITLNQRTLFEFYRRFGSQPLSDDAVWPPLMNSMENG
ncbi:WYL domain-containing protein [Acidithiobacillus montserratensis]|uniref:WYL domain-containing protein n=1 Tax=Acidithiobacillus montserratensis TaxID=2729135 RepID=A0ACD5HJD0_9PROT|nr:WYL domain-containing protein [Acidithiobacillus montserratensis]MBU2746591.1 WYL domain-containing protein [Acidithiobacillus montserratensis]